jgi:potassium efflux system protein
MMKEFFDNVMQIFNSEYPFAMLANKMWQIILEIWDYRVFTTADKHQILVSNIILSLVFFFIGIKVVKRLNLMIKRRLTKVVVEESMVNSLERLSYYFFMTLMVVFVLDVSNVPLTIFTVIGTTLALGIGLGSQNIVNNFISGIIIMIERPIKVGDIIEVKGVAGKVTNIGARCTSIRTNRNINILLPNSNILQDVIVNWTLEDTILKISMELILENKVDLAEMDELILGVLSKHLHVLSDPEPEIMLKELFSNGYVLGVDFWIDLAFSGKSAMIINDINRALSPILKSRNIAIIDRNYYPSSHSSEAGGVSHDK